MSSPKIPNLDLLASRVLDGAKKNLLEKDRQDPLFMFLWADGDIIQSPYPLLERGGRKATDKVKQILAANPEILAYMHLSEMRVPTDGVKPEDYPEIACVFYVTKAGSTGVSGFRIVRNSERRVVTFADFEVNPSRLPVEMLTLYDPVLAG